MKDKPRKTKHRRKTERLPARLPGLLSPRLLLLLAGFLAGWLACNYLDLPEPLKDWLFARLESYLLGIPAPN
jgi:hypothetical protein